jgi:hypothetical protein
MPNPNPNRPEKKLFPNPFYVLLLLASVAFVITTFGYLIGPTIQQQAAAKRPPGEASIALAKWFDRMGPTALAVEFVVMLASAFLAMATDRWFPSKRTKRDMSKGPLS